MRKGIQQGKSKKIVHQSNLTDSEEEKKLYLNKFYKKNLVRKISGCQFEFEFHTILQKSQTSCVDYQQNKE